MRFDDRYATAVRSNKLRSDADKTGDVDILGAAGLAGKLVRTLPDGTTAPGAPLAMALLRLFTGDRRAAREIVEITAGMLVGKAHRLGAALDRPELVAAGVLGWHMDPACKACNGHGFHLIEGAPALSDQACGVCRGTGKRPFDPLFTAEALPLARWLAAEIEREAAKAGPAAMAALRDRMDR